MPIVKYIAIHVSPKSFLKYIINGDKNSDMKYATGINCDIDNCYNEFKTNFEYFSMQKFHKPSNIFQSDAEKKKEMIRLHHYIQSFVPGEITPEDAHRLGIEWAKKVFGKNRKVIVSTHVDTDHIHNHVAVASYDDEGQKWYGNKKSLKIIRSVSDKIARANGYFVLENVDRYKNNRSYAETIAKRNGTSWKVKMRNDIDNFILSNDVNSIEDLIGKMEELGYTVTKKKYISIKAPNAKHAIRSMRLGDGYSYEHLQYRIINKEQEMSYAEIDNYSGIQKEYALMLRQMQLTVYKKAPSSQRILYNDIYKRTQLLNYIYRNGIKSENDFSDLVNEKDNTYQELNKEKKQLDTDLSEMVRAYSDAQRYVQLLNQDDLTVDEIDELRNYAYLNKYSIRTSIDVEMLSIRLQELQKRIDRIDDEIKKAEEERNEITEYYKTYLNEREQYKFFGDIAREQYESDNSFSEELMQLDGLEDKKDELQTKRGL